MTPIRGSGHETWARQLPEMPGDLWEALMTLEGGSRMLLFAHCASLTDNVVKEPWKRRPVALDHGERIALAVALNMVAAGWRPTVKNYLGRAPKARILDAVRESKGEAPVQLIGHLKKPDMAKEAERLLDGAASPPS